MSNVAGISFPIKMQADYWDPGYDDNFQFDDGPEPNTPDAVEFDEKGFWLEAGTSDGQQGNGSKYAFIPNAYKADYLTGYNAGAWFRLVMMQN